MLNKTLSKQKGLSLIEITVILAIISIFAIALYPKITGVLGKTHAELSLTEITGVITAMRQVRDINLGKYYVSSTKPVLGTTITNTVGMEYLSNNGFHVEPFTNGVGENVYGKTIRIAAEGTSATTLVDAKLTYETDSEKECKQLALRIIKIVGVTLIGNGCSSAGLLSLDID